MLEIKGKFSAVSWTGLLGLLLLGQPVSLRAIELAPGPEQVFLANGKRTICAQFHNPDAQPAEAHLRYRLYQTGGRTMMPLGEVSPWKTSVISGDQTVLEFVAIDLPAVRSETLFRVVWFNGEKKIGATSIHAFPDDLLKPLRALASDKPVGLIDPEDQFKSALSFLSTERLRQAEDIVSAEVGLILIAPMSSQNRPAGLTAAVKKKAGNGAGIVWIQPSSRGQSESLPEAFVINEQSGRIVVASTATTSNLVDSPQSQLNLVRLAELASGRKKLELPADP